MTNLYYYTIKRIAGVFFFVGLVGLRWPLARTKRPSRPASAHLYIAVNNNKKWFVSSRQHCLSVYLSIYLYSEILDPIKQSALISIF